jgi:hypothetical protein
MLLRRVIFPDFCEPCLPSPAAKPPAGARWLHEIKHDGFRMLVRHDAAGVRLFTRNGHNLLLTSVAALLIATSAAHTRELSKSQSWKRIQGTWCVGNHPTDNEAYAGIARDKCGDDEQTLIIRDNGYRWEHEDGLNCRYLSGKARFDNAIPASTKTVGVWVFHIIAACIRTHEGAIRKYTHSFDMYVSKATLWIENLRRSDKPTSKRPSVVQPTKTARAPGLDIPATLLARADEVIE